MTISIPGKDLNIAANYRPISILSVCYKRLEWLTLRCITPLVKQILSPDQAGFCKQHSTCDQVAALTTYIENGFQQNLKTGTVFLALTAAYDTVWYTGLFVKLSTVMAKSLNSAQFIMFFCNIDHLFCHIAYLLNLFNHLLLRHSLSYVCYS